jgi:hypothetical protein
MRRAATALVVVVAVAAAAAVALPTGGAADEPRVIACEGAAALRFECFERRYVALVRARGAPAALRDLARERARNGYVRAACHQLTHRAGRVAGAIDGIGAFDDGAPLCSSGFYHGVVEAVMERIGAAHVVARAAGVCAGLRERDRRSADHYNCAHGMGHGFMGSFATDVFASLRGCDALADGWERHACYGGVFMENLSAIGHPTRPPTALRPRDPLYPCTAVRRRYREACFDKQTTYALFVTDSDFAHVFALCSRVERAFRGACYRGLGGDIAVDAAKHVFEARAQARSRTRLCGLGPDRTALRECVIGVVRVILRDLAGGAAQTTAFCRALGSADLRRVCRRAREAAYRDLPLHDTLVRSAPVNQPDPPDSR